MKQEKEDIFDKLKRFADKTEDFIEEQVDKLKESGALNKATDYADKTSGLIEKKAKQFKESDISNKINNWVDKTEVKAKEVIKKVDDFMGELHKKPDQKNNPGTDSENKPENHS